VELFKYHGLGNDFLLVDKDYKKLCPEYIRKLCHRQFGIGADGLIHLEKRDDLLYAMSFFNADGTQAAFCGNAMRTSFLHINCKNTKIICGAGMIEGRVEGQMVSVKMPEPKLISRNNLLHQHVYDHYCCGVDHALIFLDKDPILAQKLRDSCNCNVSFVQKKTQDLFELQTFEKGVEDFTLACGSAAACLAKRELQEGMTLCVNMRGGQLKFFRDKQLHLWMRGEASRIARIDIDESF
jgi:diaminopimelate epimerase